MRVLFNPMADIYSRICVKVAPFSFVLEYLRTTTAEKTFQADLFSVISCNNYLIPEAVVLL